jgi:protein-L-isoaspartate(D-aspartate) O-methyltransferase
MTDFATARENMVESQVRPNGITDHRVIEAMAAVAREDFVPAARRAVAYMDEDIPLTGGHAPRCLIEAMAFARLVNLAVIRPEDRVLQIGAATGYGSAVLARLAAEVVAVESDPGLAAKARDNLKSIGNVKVVEGPLEAGAPADGPFDVILVEGQVADVPAQLIAQARDGGRVVAVVGETAMGRAYLWTVSGGKAAGRPAFDASVAELPGFSKRKPAFVF